MDIKSVASYSSSVAVAARPMAIHSNENVDNAESNKDNLPNNQQHVEKEDKNISKEDAQKIADGLNDFMASLNTDVKFVLHQKMKELMVQVVDNKTHKVLREAPPKELLDTLARIRDFVGALLDKKI